jgi:hypothetical protein
VVGAIGHQGILGVRHGGSNSFGIAQREFY